MKIGVKIYNDEAKTLESITQMHLPVSFKHDLESALLESEAYSPDQQSGGYVRKTVIKAEYEADNLLAYHYRQGLCDHIFSTDSNLSALGRTSCIFIQYLEQKRKNK